MSASVQNRLLASLTDSCRETILRSARLVDLPVRTQLYWPEETPQYAYFMEFGIASIVAGLDDGGTSEVGVIGNEGLIGAFHLLGPLLPYTESFMQVAGSGYRIPLPALHRAFHDHEEIRTRILEFVQQHSMVVSQVAACNNLHEAEARLARWLLMLEDRIHSNTIRITQEFAGQMIGTRRTTVNGILGVLQKKGLLDHHRGVIIISDRRCLEAAACDCYPLIRKSLDQLYVQTHEPLLNSKVYAS